jgi:anti-anti-sigma factor
MARLNFDDQALSANTQLVVVSGELDLSNVSDLRRHVDAALLSGHTRIVIDLDEVTHMDSSGLAELITCHQLAEELGGAMALVVTAQQIRRTLEIRGVRQLFNITCSRDEAVAALGA